MTGRIAYRMKQNAYYERLARERRVQIRKDLNALANGVVGRVLGIRVTRRTTEGPNPSTTFVIDGAGSGTIDDAIEHINTWGRR